MTLRLSRSELSQIESTLQTLLSPLEYSDLATWQQAALDEIHKVVDAHHSSFWMPGGDAELSVVGCEMENRLVRILRDSQQRALTGQSPDGLMHQATSARLQRGSGVYHEREITNRETVESSPLYQNAFRPAGIRYTIGMSTPLPAGEGGVVIAFERSDVEGYEESGVARLRLLLPAFVTGCSIAHRFCGHEEALGQMFDALQDPVFLLRKDGRTLHQNKAFTRLLAAEPQSGQLLAAIRAHAEALRKQRFKPNTKTKRSSAAGIAASTDYSTDTADYQLNGSYVEPAVLGTDAVMVSVRVAVRRTANVRRVQERCRLTPREAEVAALVAKGLTNKGIAQALHISPHTVKHHVSHIMNKLGVASRSAVVARLLLVD